MEEKDLTWYSPFVFFAGAILSFADPITDILTLVEFYRANHKIWFGVGLTFVLLPCLAFPIVFCHYRINKLSPFTFSLGKNCSLRIASIFSSLRKTRSFTSLSQGMVL